MSLGVTRCLCHPIRPTIPSDIDRRLMIPLTSSVPDIEDIDDLHNNKHNAEHTKVSIVISAEVTNVIDVSGVTLCH